MPRYFQLCLESTGLSVQWKKRKIDFQDGGHVGHLGVSIETILASFLFTSFPDTSFQVLSQIAFRAGKEAQNEFLTPV